MAQLGAVSRQLCTKLGPTETQHGEHGFKRSVIDSKKMWKHTSENGRFEDFGLGPAMGPSWGQVAPSWRQVGPKLEPIGPSWAEVGPLLPKVDPKSGQCCGHVGSKRSIWAILGRFAKCVHYHSPVRFLAACFVRKCPQLKLYQSDRSVRSHLRINYHASAPSVLADFRYS